MRIAWLGPVGGGGGVPSMGALLLESILRQQTSVTYFTHLRRSDLPSPLREFENLQIVNVENKWQWGRWYSRHPLMSFISGMIARARMYNRLALKLVELHRLEPLNCVFRLSQAELFKLGRHLDELLPVIVYRCVHAAGE